MAMAEAEDDQGNRIEDLKRRAEELCDGPMELCMLKDCSTEAEETF